MATPVPVKEVDCLLSDYVSASGEVELVAPLAGRAWTLAHRHPHSFAARALYGSILLALAKRGQAVNELISARDLCDPRDYAIANSLAVSLARIGFYEDSLEVFRKILSLPKLTNSEEAVINAIMVAALAGKIESLKAFSQIASPCAAVALDYLRMIDGHGLLEHIEAHQSIIRSAIQDIQCSGIITAFQEEDETPAIYCEYKVLCDRALRKALDRQIFERLEDYYTRQGLPPGYYIGRLTTVLIPVSEYRQGEQAA